MHKNIFHLDVPVDDSLLIQRLKPTEELLQVQHRLLFREALDLLARHVGLEIVPIAQLHHDVVVFVGLEQVDQPHHVRVVDDVHYYHLRFEQLEQVLLPELRLADLLDCHRLLAPVVHCPEHCSETALPYSLCENVVSNLLPGRYRVVQRWLFN